MSADTMTPTSIITSAGLDILAALRKIAEDMQPDAENEALVKLRVHVAEPPRVGDDSDAIRAGELTSHLKALLRQRGDAERRTCASLQVCFFALGQTPCSGSHQRSLTVDTSLIPMIRRRPLK